MGIPANNSLQLNSAIYQKLVGPGRLVLNALANTRVGTGSGYVASFSFRATETASPSALKFYAQGGSGYSDGNGGQIRFRVCSDSGGKPNVGDVYGEALYTPQLDMHTPSRASFPLLFFRNKRQLIAGNIYHLFQDNPLGNDGNYISSNNMQCPTAMGRCSPWLKDMELATHFGTSAQNLRNFTGGADANKFWAPIFQLYFSNGKSLGNGIMEGGYRTDVSTWTVAGGSEYRERFNSVDAGQYNGVSFAVVCQSPGTLNYYLDDLTSGAVVLTGSVSESQSRWAPTKLGRSETANHTWYHRDHNPVYLQAGRPYALRFRAGSGSWVFGDVRRGDEVGFTYPAAFTDSNGERKQGGSWVGINHWSKTDSGWGMSFPVVLHKV